MNTLKEKLRWQQLMSGQVDGRIQGTIDTLDSLDPVDLELGPGSKESKENEADPYHEIKEDGMREQEKIRLSIADC